MMYPIEEIRASFPILEKRIYGKKLVYLDNGATTQKPLSVIERMSRYYREENSNIHRGVHFLSNQATMAFEEVREQVASFINASQTQEVVFTKGTTESINLVSYGFREAFLKEGSEVLISTMEHHANIVPWQIACERAGARLKVIPLLNSTDLDLQAFESLLGPKTALLAITQMSNVLGTINPVKELIKKAHKLGVPVLLDGAQSIAHFPIDVQDLDCDFFCFSGHKMYAPMGVGVLYGKEKYLKKLPVFQSGGEMIQEVSFEKTTFNELPFFFEPGTPSVADVLGLGEAIRFLSYYGMDRIARYEHEIFAYALQRLQEIDTIRVFGEAESRGGLVSFLLGTAHPYDVGSLLDKMGIAVRTGHHCAQPLMTYLGIVGTARASFAMYTTFEEIDILIDALKKIKPMLE